MPIHVESARPSFAASPSFSEYMRRMIRYTQMDIDYTLAQMVFLIYQPRKVYQLTSYRKQTKNQWARDDPAFLVMLMFFLTISSIAYGLALQVGGSGIMRVIFYFVGVQFAISGAAIATACWFISNKYLRVQSFHGVEQPVEWMYAFDIHCNAFFPLFLALYVVHYFLLPFLIQQTLAATLVGNGLYAAALCYYCYITSLGYGTLPFLERTEVFLYPSGGVVGIVLILCLCGVNLTRMSVTGLAT